MTHLKEFYQKVRAFEDQLTDESKRLSQCQKGCARCCYVDLSIFEIEAQNIRNWFHEQSIDYKTHLKSLWQKDVNETENFDNQRVKSCVFLHDETCTIYEARPLICRTQGLPLKYRFEEQSYLDICPLNESMLDVIGEKEILNLELLNTILSQIENMDSNQNIRDRVSLKNLRSELQDKSD